MEDKSLGEGMVEEGTSLREDILKIGKWMLTMSLITAENGRRYNSIEGANDVREPFLFAKALCVQDSDTPGSYSGCSSKRTKQRKKRDLRNCM